MVCWLLCASGGGVCGCACIHPPPQVGMWCSRWVHGCVGVRVRCGEARMSWRVNCQYVRCDDVLAAVCEWGGVCGCACIHPPSRGCVVLRVGSVSPDLHPISSGMSTEERAHASEICSFSARSSHSSFSFSRIRTSQLRLRCMASPRREAWVCGYVGVWVFGYVGVWACWCVGGCEVCRVVSVGRCR